MSKAGSLLVLGSLFVVGCTNLFSPTRVWAPAVASSRIDELRDELQQSSLSMHERSAISCELDRIGTVVSPASDEDGAKSDALVDSIRAEIMEANIVRRAYESRIEPSQLEVSEKHRARQTLVRYARSYVTGKLSEDDGRECDQLLRDPVTGQFREQVTTAELRAFLRRVDAAADTAGIPADLEERQPAEEIRRLIDDE